jgi:hypothetical protein
VSGAAIRIERNEREKDRGMKMRIAVCLAVALCAAVSAAAQQGAAGSGSATRSVEVLAERSPVRDILRESAALALTRDQVRALEGMDGELSARSESALAALRSAEAGDGAGDQPGPGRRLLEARGAIVQAQREAGERAWALLTPEQRQRYQRIVAERRSPRTR